MACIVLPVKTGIYFSRCLSLQILAQPVSIFWVCRVTIKQMVHTVKSRILEVKIQH